MIMPSEHECDQIMERLKEQDQKFYQHEKQLGSIQRDLHNHVREVRADLQDHIVEQADRYNEQVDRHNELLAAQRQNTEAITALTESTKGMIETWSAFMSLVKTISILGELVKWGSGIVIAGGVLYAYFSGGLPV